ncbi:Protein TIFY 3B [Vitis vinifera]|uniref:Protein TIFY n=1 Tax=Vitis vinifera TaxID=29760 RepID=A0A438GUK2_VITVI|nr:Protein TIFY 3B [Vitis vinifera]
MEKVAMNEHQTKSGLKQTNDMSRTISMFRKYLISKTQSDGGKTNVDESETIKRSPLRPLMAPKFGGGSPRLSSLLEQELLPGLRCDNIISDSSDDKFPGAQLTIFYAGTINVYDHITMDKVQTILHFARESSSPTNSEAMKIPKKDPTIAPSHPSGLPSSADYKLVIFDTLANDFPIARKSSLQRFLEKRRDRITSRSPYASSSTKHKENEQK